MARLKIIVSSSLPKSKKSKKKWARAYRYPGAQGLSLEAELELTCRTVTRLFHNAAPPKPSIRKYSVRTFPSLKIQHFLASLFSHPAIRAKYMARSMLYRRAAGLDMFFVPWEVDLDDDDPETQERLKRRKENRLRKAEDEDGGSD